MGTSPSEWGSLRRDFAIICIGKEVTKYTIIALSKKKLIDTDGVGDVYVEGCLSVFVHEEKCDALCAASAYAQMVSCSSQVILPAKACDPSVQGGPDEGDA